MRRLLWGPDCSPLSRHAATKGILVAMACTFFEAFNVPVFWPILVMYFIMLFCITMKRQIKVRAWEGWRQGLPGNSPNMGHAPVRGGLHGGAK